MTDEFSRAVLSNTELVHTASKALEISRLKRVGFFFFNYFACFFMHFFNVATKKWKIVYVACIIFLLGSTDQ